MCSNHKRVTFETNEKFRIVYEHEENDKRWWSKMDVRHCLSNCHKSKRKKNKVNIYVVHKDISRNKTNNMQQLNLFDLKTIYN